MEKQEKDTHEQMESYWFIFTYAFSIFVVLLTIIVVSYQFSRHESSPIEVDYSQVDVGRYSMIRVWDDALPIVGTDLTGVENYLIDWPNAGVIIPWNNGETASEAIKRWASQPER